MLELSLQPAFRIPQFNLTWQREKEEPEPPRIEVVNPGVFGWRHEFDHRKGSCTPLPEPVDRSISAELFPDGHTLETATSRDRPEITHPIRFL